MGNYHFGGLNVWTYSENRAIWWLGIRGTHYSERKHYLKYERGRAGDLGLQITVGGEERDISLRIGLLITTIYLSVTNLVPNRYKKATEIAELINEKESRKTYAYEIDYSGQGRSTGINLSFGEVGCAEFRLWDNGDYWTSRGLRDKFKHFPYCEGASYRVYWATLRRVFRKMAKVAQK
jgi:hypothetical protein